VGSSDQEFEKAIAVRIRFYECRQVGVGERRLD